MNKYYSLMVLIILMTVSLSSHAVDGDVVYSAPYIWVNPETGEIETVNPGPRLKNHEQVAAPAATQSTMMDLVPETADEATPASHTLSNTQQAVIVLIGIAVCVGLITMMGRKTTT